MKQLDAQTFEKLKELYSLNDKQVSQFQTYAKLLEQRSQEFNLTTRNTAGEIVEYHFTDSLAAVHCFNFNKSSGCVDVGSGAGFPGIPLKIMFPELPFILIEVLAKRQKFLKEVIEALQLSHITVYEFDWRQFLRTTSSKADVFVSRASLIPSELLRLFQPSTNYNSSTLLYWGSKEWNPSPKESTYYTRSFWYQLHERTRQIAQFNKRIE